MMNLVLTLTQQQQRRRRFLYLPRFQVIKETMQGVVDLMRENDLVVEIH